MGTEVWEPGMCRLHADAGAARGSGRKLSCDAFIHQFIYFVFFLSGSKVTQFTQAYTVQGPAPNPPHPASP